jgi:hypothetical protein
MTRVCAGCRGTRYETCANCRGRGCHHCGPNSRPNASRLAAGAMPANPPPPGRIYCKSCGGGGVAK